MRAGWRRVALCGSAGVALVVLSSSRWGSAGADPVTADQPQSTVVVAASDLSAGTVVDSSMLTTAAISTSATAGLITDAATLVGQVLVVPVVRGEPVAGGMTTRRPTAATGHREVRVSVGSVDVAPDVRVGVNADLVASFPSTAADARPTVAVVATALVTSLERTADAPTPDTMPTGGGSMVLGATMAVTLDCASSDALRILWARDNARTLRLLAHPAGDATPPAVTAPP